MSMSDPLADMLTTIRNGQRVKLARVSTPASKMKQGVLNVLKNEGYIKDFAEEEVRAGVKRLSIELNYHQGEPVIKELHRISKPGLRQYNPIEGLPKYYNGLGISILSTSKGILSDADARAQHVGGELLCNVF